MLSYKKFLFIISVLFLVSNVSGSLIKIENNFKTKYNIMDKLTINFSIQENLKEEGFLEIVLDCDNESLSVYKSYQEIESNTKKYFILEIPLLLEGRCGILIDYANNKYSSSEKFDITRNINLDYSVNNIYINPKDNLVINGSAIKDNLLPFNGEIIISLKGIFNKSIDSINGRFLLNEVISKNTAPGIYNLIVLAIERNSTNNIINSGKLEKQIEIISIPDKIEVYSTETFKPPYNLSFNARLLDQVGKDIENQSMIFKIFNPERNIVHEGTIINNNSYFFESDALAGGWEINLYYGELSAKKPLFVQENKEIKIEIKEKDGKSYFELKNTGNVRYQGTKEIIIKNNSFEKKFLLNIDLNKGEVLSESVNLTGEYQVSYDGDIIENVNLTSSNSSTEDFSKITGNFVYPKIKFNIYSYIFSIMFILFLILFYIAIIKNRILAKRKNIN